MMDHEDAWFGMFMIVLAVCGTLSIGWSAYLRATYPQACVQQEREAKQ